MKDHDDYWIDSPLAIRVALSAFTLVVCFVYAAFEWGLLS